MINSEKIIESINFDTNWANFTIFKTSEAIYEVHCGYSKGCFETEPEELIFPQDTPLEAIKSNFIQFYGAFKK